MLPSGLEKKDSEGLGAGKFAGIDARIAAWRDAVSVPAALSASIPLVGASGVVCAPLIQLPRLPRGLDQPESG